MDGTCTSGVTEGAQWLPHLGKHPHQQGDQWGQRTSPGDRQHGMTPTKVVHAPAHVPQPETRIHQCRSELGAGPCGWEHRPGRGPPLALRSQPEGMEVRSSTSGNACGRSLDQHGSQVPLPSDVQRPGLPRKLLSSTQAPASTDTGEGSQWSWLVCPCHHLPPPQSGCHTCPAHP